jgi:hypothetical protein
MEFWMKVVKIANGYTITYPGGGKVTVDHPLFPLPLQQDKTIEWYVQTKKQLEEVLPRICLEGLARVELEHHEAVDKKKREA